MGIGEDGNGRWEWEKMGMGDGNGRRREWEKMGMGQDGNGRRWEITANAGTLVNGHTETGAGLRATPHVAPVTLTAGLTLVVRDVTAHRAK